MKGRKPASIVAGTVSTVLRPPSWLSADARAEWKRIIGDLVARGILSEADMGLLEDLCVQRGRIRDLERRIQASPDLDFKLVRAQKDAIQTARQIAAEIGATPVSRSRPTVHNEQNDDEEHLSDLGL